MAFLRGSETSTLDASRNRTMQPSRIKKSERLADSPRKQREICVGPTTRSREAVLRPTPRVASRATRTTVEAVSWRAGLVLVARRGRGAGRAGGGGAAAHAAPRSGMSACAACHGADGAGQPRAVLGFDVQVPDLRDCTFATAEPTPDWLAVVHEGGPVRGLESDDARLRGRPQRRGDRARGRLLARLLPGAARLAARRPEPAARAVHREGVPGKRAGADLGDRLTRARAA